MALGTKDPVDEINRTIQNQIEVIKRDNMRFEADAQVEQENIANLHAQSLEGANRAKHLEIEFNHTNSEFRHVLH
jgi:hypothetical protein